MNKTYQPPFQLTHRMTEAMTGIAELLGAWKAVNAGAPRPELRRGNRIRSIQASLAVEQNRLTLEQVTAVLEGRHVLGSPREIQEVRNAFAAYESMGQWRPDRAEDLLAAHGVMMAALVDDAGRWRRAGVGVMAGDKVIHMAPPASQVPRLMQELLHWLPSTEAHPLIASAAFHYEFEFIHPFSDGNGRMGRLWQTLILSRWNPLFEDVPVESLVYEQQAAYYQAIGESTQQADAAAFVEFMLSRILEAVASATPQVAPHVTPQVARLLLAIQGDMGREALQDALALQDRKSFRERYLKPALEHGLIEMTLPDTPNSRLQKYRLTDQGRLWLNQRKER